MTFSSNSSSSSSVDSARWFTASTAGLWLGLPIRRAQQLNWRTSVVWHSHNTSERSFSFAPFHVQLFLFLFSVVFNSLKEWLVGWCWLALASVVPPLYPPSGRLSRERLLLLNSCLPELDSRLFPVFLLFLFCFSGCSPSSTRLRCPAINRLPSRFSRCRAAQHLSPGAVALHSTKSGERERQNHQKYFPRLICDFVCVLETERECHLAYRTHCKH